MMDWKFSATSCSIPLLFRYFPPPIFFRYQQLNSATFEKSSGEIRYLAAVTSTALTLLGC